MDHRRDSHAQFEGRATAVVDNKGIIPFFINNNSSGSSKQVPKKVSQGLRNSTLDIRAE
jgi:hypothetical protein